MIYTDLKNNRYRVYVKKDNRIDKGVSKNKSNAWTLALAKTDDNF